MEFLNANGAKIPAIGFGTWPLKDEACVDMVSRALRAGYRHIDTAAFYGNEREVGEGIRQSGVAREDIFLTTKIWYSDIADGDLQRSVESSLELLEDNAVDLALIHWPSATVSLQEAIGALNDVKTRGLARNIGVSNFTNAMVDEAASISAQPLSCNQVENHPYLDQSKMRATCAKHGMALIAYCPLGRGGDLFQERVIVDAARNHSKSSAQIVLRWHVQHDGGGAIPKTSTPERLQENLDVFDFCLSSEEMKAISSLGAANKRICDFDFSPAWD